VKEKPVEWNALEVGFSPVCFGSPFPLEKLILFYRNLPGEHPVELVNFFKLT
jgi:hypothetical protein